MISGKLMDSRAERGVSRVQPSPTQKGMVIQMGSDARIGLLLGATACLLAVMVDWVVEELNS